MTQPDFSSYFLKCVSVPVWSRIYTIPLGQLLLCYFFNLIFGRERVYSLVFSNNMSSHRQPAEKFFTLFPRLPPELQFHIWTLALPGPQLIYITCLNTQNEQVVIDIYIYPEQHSSEPPQISCSRMPLLSICVFAIVSSLDKHPFSGYLPSSYQALRR